MTQFQSKFHIEDDAGPDEIYQYLDTIIAEKPSDDTSLKNKASELGHSIGSAERIRVGPILKRLGVVEPDDKFSLSKMGDELLDIMYDQPRLFDNILHYLYYTAVDRFPEEYIYTSYTYQKFTNYIHRNHPFESFHGNKSSIVSAVGAELQQDEDIDTSRTEAGVSISTKTFNGFLKFVTELEPSINPNEDGGTPGYNPRGFCPPELFVLGVDYIYNQTDTDYGTLLSLTDEVKIEIGQLCLLSDDGVENVADFSDDSFEFFAVNQDFGKNYLLNQSVGVHDFS